MTSEGQLPPDDNSVLCDNKIEVAIFSSAFIAVFERLNFIVFEIVGKHVRQLYDEKSDDKEILAVQKVLKEKYNNKNALSKENIIDVMIELGYLSKKEKEEYFTLKAIRDEIAHKLLDSLLSDERLDKSYLERLVELFKKILIKIHNELLLSVCEEYKDAGLVAPEDPFKTIATELMLIDTLLSSIIDRKTNTKLFKILEED